jgi:putative spermidine/putrescine transport system ATP-binding protein
MSIADNVGYGLMVRGVSVAERRKRVAEALELVRLSGFDARRPGQLSGGQRQRVALARALINHPRVLLLDEPLGALDLKLREQMQFELKTLQRRVGITFVYVTHDQQEALSMSDRVAVFNHGRIEQVATPEDLYDRPATAFVAQFVGSSNVLSQGDARACTGSGRAFAIRPERIRMLENGQAPGGDWCVVRGSIAGRQFLGAATRYQVTLPSGTHLQVLVPGGDRADGSAAAPGDATVVGWRRSDMHPLPEDTAGRGNRENSAGLETATFPDFPARHR